MKTIVSIWPMQEVAYRALHMPLSAAPVHSNLFILEPGSIERPTLLRVPDYNNMVYIGKGISHMTTIHDWEIAPDLVNQWRHAKNMPDDTGLPGIWMCSLDTPTLEQVLELPELREASELQLQFASSKLREARLHAAQGDWRNITRMHLFMGRLLNVQGEPWQDFDSKAQAGKVRCPYCDTPMAVGAAVCGQCREIVSIERYNQIRESQGLLPKALPAAAPKPS